MAAIFYLLLSVPLPVAFTICGTLLVTALMYFDALLNPRKGVPSLYYKQSTLTDHVLKKCRRLTQPFRPTFWASNAHVQTLLPSMMPCKEFYYEREYLQMRDKGIIALDWGITNVKKLQKRSPIIIIIPGLTGDASGMTNICEKAVSQGFRPVVFNKRGHGGCPLTTPKLQSFGDPSDLRQAVKYIRGKYPCAKMTAVGYSAGSGLLVSYLGEYGSSTYLTASVCISAGYDAEDLFGRGIKQPYDWFLLACLKSLVSKHAKVLSQVLDIDTAFRSTTVHQFEENLYCKLYGYENMSLYWEKNNPMRDVDEIAIPTLCISSLDDPVCAKENIPLDLFKMYPNFLLAVTEKGGHCGFLEGTCPDHWADKVAIDYLDAVLDFMAKESKPTRYTV